MLLLSLALRLRQVWSCFVVYQMEARRITFGLQEEAWMISVGPQEVVRR